MKSFVFLLGRDVLWGAQSQIRSAARNMPAKRAPSSAAMQFFKIIILYAVNTNNFSTSTSYCVFVEVH